MGFPNKNKKIAKESQMQAKSPFFFKQNKQIFFSLDLPSSS
jgi:hypothetical protein